MKMRSKRETFKRNIPKTPADTTPSTQIAPTRLVEAGQRQFRVPSLPNNSKLELELTLASPPQIPNRPLHPAKWHTEKSVRKVALEISGDLHNPAVLARSDVCKSLPIYCPAESTLRLENDLKTTTENPFPSPR